MQLYGIRRRNWWKTPEELEEARLSIIKRVSQRQRMAWYRNYRRAMQEADDRKDDYSWRRWLVEGIASEKSPENYNITVSEEAEAHIILRAIDVTLENFLRKNADRYPGLQLRAGVHRSYPFMTSAAHLMGRVSRVSQEDQLAADAPTGELRVYLANDEIGRGGVESLCELALRGTKGKIEKVPGRAGETSHLDPQPGQNVKLTIDIDVQKKVEDELARGLQTARETPPEPKKKASASSTSFSRLICVMPW